MKKNKNLIKTLPIKIIFLILMVSNISCNSNKSKLYLECENANGITTETKLEVNGFIIGNVTDLKLKNNGKVIIVTEINKDINIPKNTQFFTSQNSLLGSKTIEVKYGNEKELLNIKDTLKLEIKKEKSNENNVFDLINKTLEKKLNDQDSLLIEIRELNNKLEKLNEK